MVERVSTGLVVGRFDPPHLGHSHLIEWSAERCERLVVFVNTSEERDVVPGSLRAGWLAELHERRHEHGSVTVVEVRHRLRTDFSDEALWARWMQLFRERWPHETGPDAVFSSDPYVDELARRFGSQAVPVDPDRVAVPISATEIRHDPAAHLHRLAPPVRAWVERHWLGRHGP